MRIAFTGPTPSNAGGARYAMTVLLKALAAEGVEIDLYTPSSPEFLMGVQGLEILSDAVHEDAVLRRLDRAPLAQFVSGQSRRALRYNRLASRLLAKHRRRPYDAVYQFSQPELLGLRRHRAELPPIVLHSGSHAAGELAWHRREDALALRCESRVRITAVRAMLRIRSALQRRDLAVVDAVVCPSETFASDLARDYSVPVSRLHVVPHAVDLGRFSPSSAARRRPREILFVSRLAVRKGVELVVDLSHRLEDRAGDLMIVVIGDATMWSDYRPLLRSLNERTANFAGYVDPTVLPETLGRASLLVQPSHYEPFALTVAESLACGTPVVVSDRVGAGEWVEPGCGAIFPVGDADAFERAVRAMLVRADESESSICQHARSVAEQNFAPAAVARRIRQVLEDVVATRGRSRISPRSERRRAKWDGRTRRWSR